MASLRYGKGGTAFTLVQNGNFNIDGSTNLTAWSLVGGTISAVLQDASDSSYASTGTFNEGFFGTIIAAPDLLTTALVPATSILTNADIIARMKRTTPVTGAGPQGFVAQFNTSTIDHVALGTLTTSFVDYTLACPNLVALGIGSPNGNMIFGVDTTALISGTVLCSALSVLFTFTLPVPSINTLDAQTISSTAAQLHGSYETEAMTITYPLTYYWEYGTSTAYGLTTSSTQVTAASGGNPIEVATNIGSLNPSTTYHFRFVGSTADGIVNGSDFTFTTLAGDPILMTL